MKKLNDLYVIEQVIRAMQLDIPESTSTSTRRPYQAKAEQYRQLVIANCHQRNKTGFARLPLNKIRKQLGDYVINKKRYYYLDWFQSSEFALFTVVQKGSNIDKELTMVKLNVELATAREVATWDKQTIEDNFAIKAQEGDEVWYSPIDRASLYNYIKSTEYTLEQGHRYTALDQARDIKANIKPQLVGTMIPLSTYMSTRYKDNLKRAYAIYTQTAGTAVLAQPYFNSPFGRRIHRGSILNLQSAPKILRHAALGDCYSIDFVACTFAWRLQLARTLQRQGYFPGMKFSYLREMLKNRTVFRQRVADIAGCSIEKAKTIITSIGFGADISKKPWGLGDSKKPALNKILNQEQLARLKDNDWFMAFILEQTQIADGIDHAWRKDNRIKDPRFDFLRNGNGAITQSTLLAYLFQTAERCWMEELCIWLEQRGHTVLLTVHDCVYVKQDPDMHEVAALFQNQDLDLDVKLEAEQHRAYTYNDMTEITAHKERIHREELRALNHTLNLRVSAGWDDEEYRKAAVEFFERCADEGHPITDDVLRLALDDDLEKVKRYTMYLNEWASARTCHRGILRMLHPECYTQPKNSITKNKP